MPGAAIGCFMAYAGADSELDLRISQKSGSGSRDMTCLKCMKGRSQKRSLLEIIKQIDCVVWFTMPYA
jgi:hypothetical protein